MKVKNIAFSGFMAAILMGVSGAHAAINVASQAYVDGKLKNKADVAAVTTLEGTVSTLSQTVADNKSATDAAIQANADAIELKADKTALEELSSTVAGLDSTYATDVELAAEKAALQEQIAGVVAGDMKDALAAYATTEYVNQQDTALSNRITTLENVDNLTQEEADAALLLKADKSVVDGIVTALGTTSDVTAAIADAKSAGTNAQATADANAAAITVLQNKDTEIDGEIAGLKSADSAINEKIGAVTEGKTVVEMIAEAKSEATYDDTALAGRVTTAEGKISANETAIATNAENIAKKQDELSEKQLAAADSGITAEKVSSYDTAVSELANKISMPDACKQENGNCVLGIMNQKVQWINLTEPVDDEQPEA